MLDQITSATNPRIKRLRKLLESRSFRRSEGAFVLEHPAAILEQLRDHPDRIEALIVRASSPYADTAYPAPTWILSEAVWGSVRQVKSSQGIMALLKLPTPPTLSDLVANASLLLCLDRVQNPTNVGAIIRAATAFRADGILLLPGCADPFHPEALRAMAGYCFSLPFLAVTPSSLSEICPSHWTFIGLDPAAQTPLTSFSRPEKSVLILGSEGSGITAGFSYQPVSIPMSNAVESLNVAVSAGIALFHLALGSV